MKLNFKNILFLLVFFCFFSDSVFAASLSKADKLLEKARYSTITEEGYEYIHKARYIYKQEYDSNPLNIEALVGLSKTYQLTQERSEAKLYILKAYNLNPSDPKLQKAMGDFFYSFQEYTTAIEYYKLALASGLLTDFDTNLKCAKCYDKLGDSENAELYYKICNHVNKNSKEVSNKLNEYDSQKHEETHKSETEPKYKYLFKNKPISQQQKNDNEAEEIIKLLNN